MRDTPYFSETEGNNTNEKDKTTDKRTGARGTEEMKKPLRVLMVEDSEEDTLLVVRELKRGGYDPTFERVETAETMKKARTAGDKPPPYGRREGLYGPPSGIF